jgi:pimeloyl-ACP methyl ester carboxylesterase
MHHLLWLFVLPIAPLAVGMIYQVTGALRDKRRFVGLGTLVDIGHGRRLYVSHMGSVGPSVVFESGIAATSQNWLHLQRKVSTFAQTLSYDRAGLGWSTSSHSERTPSNIVEELRLVLHRAHLPPPYILVGHSFGGLVVRHFAALYPRQVAGVVLLDAMRPEDWPPVNEAQSALVERGLRLTAIAVPIARFGLARLATTSLLCRSGRTSRMFSRAAGAGGEHVLERITCEVGKMPREVWPIIAAHWSTPKFYRGLAAHLRALPATVCQMHNALPIVGMPVRLITAGTADPLTPESLLLIGPTATQVVAEKSGHWVHLDQPDLVLEAIREMADTTCANAAERKGHLETSGPSVEPQTFIQQRPAFASALRNRFVVAYKEE